MGITERNRLRQFNKLIKDCYDDYCFYNQMDKVSRKKYVNDKISCILDDELIIPYLPVYLTTKCNLNCAKCNNLIPMFKGSPFDFSWEKTKKSLDIILSEVKELIFCELVGGETFLNSELESILEYLSEQNKIMQIVIVTNGAIIPKRNILEKLKKCNALVRVSDYGLFEKMAQLVAVLDKEGINVRIQQDMKWNDPGGTEKREKSMEDLADQYNKCEFSLKCKYLCEDKIFTCARAASLYKLGITDAQGDYIEINELTSKEKLFNFYLKDYGNVCDFCDLWSKNKGGVIPAAIQVGDGQIVHSRYTIISNYELNHFKNQTKKYEKLLREENNN